MASIHDEITKTTVKLLLNEPFYGHFFTGVLKGESGMTKSMSLVLSSNQMIQFNFNPEWWQNILVNEQLQYGALKHQVLHVVFKHIFKIAEFGYKKIFAIAADLVVNQYVSQAQLLPDTPTLAHFPKLKLKSGQDVGYYYHKLVELMEECQECDKESENDLDSGCECNNESNCDKPGNGNKSQSQSKGYSNLKHFLEKEPDMTGNNWDDFQQLSGPERWLIECQLNETICNCMERARTNQYGNIPAGLLTYLQTIVESMKPQVNWKRILKLFAESSTHTYLKNTLKRPSKRYGTTPGIKIKKRNKILVAVDTSGSIDIEDLSAFFGEIYHIWKKGAQVRIVECDCTIQRVYEYKGTTPIKVKGGGGTSFEAPIEYGNTKFVPDALIYLTDGYADTPKTSTRFPILWVISQAGLTEESREWNNLRGRKIKMK